VVCRSIRLSVCLSVTLKKPCKNGAVWAEDSARPRGPCIRWGPNHPWEGAILRGKGSPIVKYRDTLRSSVQKRLNRSICRLGCGLRLAKEYVLDGSPQMLKDVAMAVNFRTQFAITNFFWLSMGYTFGCIAIDTLFDSRGGFSRSSYPIKT